MTLPYGMPSITLHLGDAIAKLKEIPDDSVDSVVTDPPYNLSFMGKKWDKKGTPQKFQEWCEEWGRECFRILRTGGFLVSFGGTRTYHRMVCGLEDAGFEIRDCLSWNYGSGFPKNHNISKAIDRLGGQPEAYDAFATHLKACREKRKLTVKQCDEKFCDGSTAWNFYEGRNFNGEKKIQLPVPATMEKIIEAWPEMKEVCEKFYQKGLVLKEDLRYRKTNSWNANGKGMLGAGMQDFSITAPATGAAERWQGYGTTLKPAFEPIVLAQKPKQGTFAANVLREGVGGLNIDACRITTEDNLSGGAYAKSGTPRDDGWGMQRGQAGEYEQPEGRFPANVLLECICEETALSEIKPSGHWSQTTTKGFGNFGSGKSLYEGVGPKEDTLVQSHTNPECPCRILDEQAPAVGNLYHSTRQKGTQGGTGISWKTAGRAAGTSNDPTGVYDGLGGASRFFYCAKASQKEKHCEGAFRNTHPTTKPLALMEWLVRLVTPTGEAMGRTPLTIDPFVGTGSTLIAASRLGVDSIGIEIDADYLDLTRLRVLHDWKLPNGLNPPATLQGYTPPRDSDD